MRQAIITNRCNSHSYVINIKNIGELEKENFFNSGLILFFDKDFELILWGSSYEDILSLAKDMYDDDVYGYCFIKDDKLPLTIDEIDNIYEAFTNDVYSIIICNRRFKMTVEVCLN